MVKPELQPIADALMGLGYPRDRVEAALGMLDRFDAALEALDSIGLRSRITEGWAGLLPVQIAGVDVAPGDTEQAHVAADRVLLELVRLAEVRFAFLNVHRWYA